MSKGEGMEEATPSSNQMDMTLVFEVISVLNIELSLSSTTNVFFCFFCFKNFVTGNLNSD